MQINLQPLDSKT